ncbi:glycosyltransferase family 4 protein [Candidatus Sumerlaeota bacterium]|nr:glycosyltransferase family 4 protein [Candidatus Sumerlaeota bacterium]
MRIVIDARYLTREYSGIRIFTERLLEHLALQDKINEYFCLVQPDYTRPIALGDNFHLIKYNARPLSLKTVFSLHRGVKLLKPDFFHVLFPLMPVFYKGKLLIHVHDLQPLMMKEWTGGRILPLKKIYEIFYWWIYPHTFRKASWIVAVSQATKDALSEIMPELAEKTIVIHSGIDLDKGELRNNNIMETLRERYHIPPRYILYVGSTRPNKNIPVMLQAFSRLKDVDPSLSDVAFVLVLTRDRFIADIMRVVKDRNLESGIRILEPVGQAEKHALYQNAQLLFFATRFEGFGFPLLEAQSYGAPVVASNCHALPEIAGDSAYLVDPGNVESLTEALRRVLTDQPLREDLINKGKQNILNFSWERTASQVLEIYNHLM